jgi:anti-sigma factor RsiW
MAEHVHNHEDCKKYLTLLSDYADGELDQDLCDMLEQHMAECEDCTIVVNTLKRTIDLVHMSTDEQEPALPDDVRMRLFKRLSLDDLRK